MRPEPVPLNGARRQQRDASVADWIRYRERGSLGLDRLMVAASLRLGRRASRGVLHFIAAYFFLFAPRARRHSRDYLTRALGRRPRIAELYRHVLYFASCIHDRIFLLNDDFDAFDMTIEGEDIMRTQLRSGNGAILIGAHLGSFEMMRSVGRRQPALQVSMAMYEDNARKLNGTLAAINPAARPDIVPLGRIDAMLQIAERLDRGAFVGMLADRTLGDEPVQAVTLLGTQARLPTGPMHVAALLRRPVIFMAGLYRGGNRYHIVFARIADFSTVDPAGRDAAVRAALDRYAALLDRCCRSDPYNWFNFFDFWRAGAGTPAV